MLKLKQSAKKRCVICLIQFIEILLVIAFIIFAFDAAGYLIYNNIFPFGSLNGILFYSMASAIAVIMLTIFKYFNPIVRLSTLPIAKMAWVVICINLLLVLLLYFNSTLKLSAHYFIVAGAIQFCALVIIKMFTDGPKGKILKDRITLVIGRDVEKSSFKKMMDKEAIRNAIFVSEELEDIEKYIDISDNVYLMIGGSALKDKIVGLCTMKNKKLFIVPDIHEIAMKDAEMVQVGDVPLLTIEIFRWTDGQLLVKRIIDIILSLLMIILALPFIGVAAVFIKLEDGGPVFYRQVRSGLNEKEFEIIKLRSMIVDAEKNTGPVLANENDSRITKTGRVLRAMRIDELPQLLNVLTGDMSIVGPRPERPVFVQKYARENPEYIQRLSVKPGITGLAQVRANYSTTAENKLKFDMLYIKKYSPILDIIIILETVNVVFSRWQSKGVPEEIDDTDQKAYTKYDIEHVKSSPGITTAHRVNIFKLAVLLLSCSIVVLSSIVLRYNSIISSAIESLDGYIISETVEVNSVNSIDAIDLLDHTQLSAGSELADYTAEIKGVRIELSRDDKFKREYMLFRHLSSKDIFFIESLMKGGMTDKEKDLIINLITSKIGEDNLFRFIEFKR